jgi:hypothetical protein
MRRAIFIVASGLAASTAVAVGALLYGPRSQPASLEEPQDAIAAPRKAPAVDTRPQKSDSTPNESTAARNESRSDPRVDDRGAARKKPVLDEAAEREMVRKEAARAVRDGYTLLLQDLALPPAENRDLISLLTELQVEGTWTSHTSGRTVGQQERYERIATVIGDEKLLRFLELEQNLRAYSETQQITSFLRFHEMPLDEAQRDGVFRILVDVHDRYDTTPPAELGRDSLERVEYVIEKLDEIDRHVLELAPSVLSPRQVAQLFAAYQHMSYERADSLERQKKRRADHPDQEIGWFYPGRWH